MITQVENVAYFCLFYVKTKMMKVENILYFCLSPIRKNKFSKKINKFRKICIFETHYPQNLIPHPLIPQ